MFQKSEKDPFRSTHNDGVVVVDKWKIWESFNWCSFATYLLHMSWSWRQMLRPKTFKSIPMQSPDLLLKIFYLFCFFKRIVTAGKKIVHIWKISQNMNICEWIDTLIYPYIINYIFMFYFHCVNLCFFKFSVSIDLPNGVDTNIYTFKNIYYSDLYLVNRNKILSYKNNRYLLQEIMYFIFYFLK